MREAEVRPTFGPVNSLFGPKREFTMFLLLRVKGRLRDNGPINFLSKLDTAGPNLGVAANFQSWVRAAARREFFQEG